MNDFISLDHETPLADLRALHELGDRAAAGRPDSVALEVGTWTGRTALVLAASFDQVFAVDHLLGNAEDRLGDLARYHGQDNLFRALCNNLGPLLCTRVYPCIGSSRTWAAAWRRPLDLVFIDGSHGYQDAYHDIQDWGRHLRPGGTMAVHDYGVFEGVTRAVDELMPGRERAGATIAFQVVASAPSVGNN